MLKKRSPSPTLKEKALVGGSKDGWINFNTEMDELPGESRLAGAKQPATATY